MAKVLMIATAHSKLGDSGNQTGLWLEELATPFYAMKDAGHDVAVATLGGKAIPIDPNSDVSGDDAPDSVKRFKDDPDAMSILKTPEALEDHNPEDFDAVFVPGGHGAMWDLASSRELAAFLSSAWEHNKVLASVCHGPAAFVNVKDKNGEPVVKARKVAAFTNTEEDGTGLTDVVPFLLESRLRELGADFQKGADWQPHAVEDGNLITGQNPMSSEAVADLLSKKVA